MLTSIPLTIPAEKIKGTGPSLGTNLNDANGEDSATRFSRSLSTLL